MSVFLRPVRCAVLAAALLVLFPLRAFSAGEPFPGLGAKWRAYHSPHFELFSRGSDRQSRAMLRDLETMRAFFIGHFELPVRDTAPVTIYVFGAPEDFRHYATAQAEAGYHLIGEYRAYLDRDVITLSDEWGEGPASWIVFSNFTSHLLNGIARQRSTIAYDGLRLLLGTATVHEKYLKFGEADSLRRNLARKHPVRDLGHLLIREEGLVPSSQELANISQAQGWAFFHYLYLGQNELPRGEVNKFLRFLLADARAKDPARLREVFRATFKADYPEMEQRLNRYMRNSRFPTQHLTLPPDTRATAIGARPVERPEMLERLAELSLRGERDPAARLAVVDALRGPRAARAAEALGSVAAQEQDDRVALDYWQRALEAGSTNGHVLRLVTRLEFARWFGSFDFYFRLAPDRAHELRALLNRNLEATPHRSEIFEMLAWVESAAPAPDLAAVNLVQRKFPELHNQSRTLLAIALIHSRLGDHASALSVLDRLSTFGPTQAEARFAEMVRPLIQEKARRAREAAESAAAASAGKP